MDYSHHQYTNEIQSDIVEDELTEIKKISKKRKKKNKDGMVILRLYFDDSSNKLKPLLIFDLNKVLVWRRTKSSFFVIRPHAIEFVIEMSKHFTLAVWTATMAYNAKKIVDDVFISNNVPLLFTWYNDKCIAGTGKFSTEQPILKATGFEADSSMWKGNDGSQWGNHFDPNSGQRGSYEYGYLPPYPNFCPPPPLDPFPYHMTSSSSSASYHHSDQSCIKVESVKKSRKVVMIKPLQFVWEAYPEYSALNTVILDDSREKCAINWPYNCIHPMPYESPQFEKNQKPEGTWRAAPKVIVEEDGTEDRELKANGALWNYIISISSCFKCGDLESDDCEGRKFINYSRKGLPVTMEAFMAARGQYICEDSKVALSSSKLN